MAQEPIVIGRESADPRYRWKQYLVVSDQRVAVVEMVPALYGWNLGRVTVQAAADWNGMARDAIVAWKLRHDDRAHVATDLEPAFRARLLALGESGRPCESY